MQETVHSSMAKFAFDQVSEHNSKEFRSLARSFPSIIQVNGLGAAVAFLLSKKDNTHKKMYDLIDTWIKRKFCPGSDDDLMKRIVNLDSGAFRLYTEEVMHLSLWVKRFAEGMQNDGCEKIREMGKGQTIFIGVPVFTVIFSWECVVCHASSCFGSLPCDFVISCAIIDIFTSY